MDVLALLTELVAVALSWPSRHDAKRWRAARAHVWRRLAARRRLRVVDGDHAEGVLDDVPIRIEIADWGRGGPSTRVRGRRVDPRAPLDARALDVVPGARVTIDDDAVTIAWERVEHDPAVIDAAVAAVVAACRYDPYRRPFR